MNDRLPQLNRLLIDAGFRLPFKPGHHVKTVWFI